MEQGELFHHRRVGTGLGRQPEAHVVAMRRVGTTLAVEKETTRPHAVFVRAWLPLHHRHCGDAERQLRQDAGLKMS